jgi:hypothetical protein
MAREEPKPAFKSLASSLTRSNAGLILHAPAHGDDDVGIGKIDFTACFRHDFLDHGL